MESIFDRITKIWLLNVPWTIWHYPVYKNQQGDPEQKKSISLQLRTASTKSKPTLIAWALLSFISNIFSLINDLTQQPCSFGKNFSDIVLRISSHMVTVWFQFWEKNSQKAQISYNFSYPFWNNNFHKLTQTDSRLTDIEYDIYLWCGIENL